MQRLSSTKWVRDGNDSEGVPETPLTSLYVIRTEKLTLPFTVYIPPVYSVTYVQLKMTLTCHLQQGCKDVLHLQSHTLYGDHEVQMFETASERPTSFDHPPQCLVLRSTVVSRFERTDPDPRNKIFLPYYCHHVIEVSPSSGVLENTKIGDTCLYETSIPDWSWSKNVSNIRL